MVYQAEGTLIMMDPNQAAVLGLFGGLDINVNPYVLDLSHEIRISASIVTPTLLYFTQLQRTRSTTTQLNS